MGFRWKAQNQDLTKTKSVVSQDQNTETKHENRTDARTQPELNEDYTHSYIQYVLNWD